MARSKPPRTVPVDLNKVRRYPYSRRKNKAVAGAAGRPMRRLRGTDFFDALPDFLKAADLRGFFEAVGKARRADKPFHLMLGAHPIKVGLSPVLIDLMERGIVTGLSLNGAGLIHDLELAFFGGTSEDVQAGLQDGTFGMVRETSQLYAAVVARAAESDSGLGEAAGAFINAGKSRHRKLSLFAAAHRLGLTATIHVGIGTDIVAQHPDFDGAAVGRASHHDFRLLCDICRRLDRGGVVANVGSAVILPEVFLKALTVARNLSRGKSRLTSANFDMILQYRPLENVVSRPTLKAGRGYNFVGHHEIMIPLVAWGLRLTLAR